MSGLGEENGLVAYEEHTQIQNIIVNLGHNTFDRYAAMVQRNTIVNQEC